MNRRQVLTAIPAAVLLAGCGSSESEQVPQVDLGTTDADPADAEYAVEIAYNHRSRLRTDSDPDDGVSSLAEGGMKWLVVGVEVTNRSETDWETEPVLYQVTVAGETYEPVFTNDENYLGDETLSPDETVTRYLLFHIPRDATEATLSVAQDNVVESVAVTFSPSDDVEILLSGS
jgi:hypothetical protein